MAHLNTRNLDQMMGTSERTPLLTIRIVPPRQRHRHNVVRRFFTIAFGSTLIALTLLGVTLIGVTFSNLPSPPIVDTHICYSSLGTSRAYASREALTNNVDDFCQDVVNDIPLIILSGWTRSKTYYPHTPEQYTMTMTLSRRVFSFDQPKCTEAIGSIINDCDEFVAGSNTSNPMNWKQGGKRVQGKYTYQIDIARQNRPWPPPTKPKQSCMGWYKFILQHYDIYGAGWANYDWGQKSLMLEINPCCGWGMSN